MEINPRGYPGGQAWLWWAHTPIVVEPPEVNGLFRLYVPDSNGTGAWHLNYPEPWMGNEAEHLHRIGVIDADELRRHRAWKRRGYGPCRGPYWFGGYPLEQGLRT